MSNDLRFRISANIDELKKALADAKKELKKLGQTSTGLDQTADEFKSISDAAKKTGRDAAQATKLGTAAIDEQLKALRAQTQELRNQQAELRKLLQQRRKLDDPAPRTPKATPTAADPNLTPAQRAAKEAQRERQRTINQAAPQLTDIGVSLAGGQNPLLVLLQQGGQLRDVFGSVGGALRAVGTTIQALITPTSVAVLGLGALALAFIKGRDESKALQSALIETGNQAGVTGDQLVTAARAAAEASGTTRSAALSAYEEIIKGGGIANEQIELVAQTALELKAKTGKDTEETVAKFAEIGKDPVAAAKKLNSEYNFLTGAVQGQIRALTEQGRTQEASKLLTDAYAKAIRDRTPEIAANLGTWAKLWKGVKEFSSGAVDVVTKPFTDDTIADKRKELAGLDAKASGTRGSSSDRAEARREAAKLRDELNKIDQEEARKAAEAVKQRNKALGASLAEATAEEARTYQTDAERRKQQRIAIINKTNAEILARVTAGDEATAKQIEANRDKILAGLDRQDAKVPSAIAQANAQQVSRDVDRGLEELDRLFAQGEVKFADYIAKKQALQLQAVNADIAANRADARGLIEPEDITRSEASYKALLDRRKAIQAQGGVELQGLEKDLQAQLLEVRIRALEEAGKQEEAALLRTEAQYRELRKRLQTENTPEAQAGLQNLDAINDGIKKAAAQRNADDLVEIKARQLESEGRLLDAYNLRTESQYRELRRRLAGNPEASGALDKLIDTERAQVRFQELQALVDKEINALQIKLQQIGQDVREGRVSSGEGQGLEAQARADATAKLEGYNAQIQTLAANSNNPAIVQGAQNINAAIKNIGSDGATGAQLAIQNLNSSLDAMNKNFASDAASAGVDAVTGLFTDLADGSKSAGDAIKDFVRGFVASMAQIAARALATFLVLRLLDAIYPGLGKMTAAAGSVGAGVKHSGGMVGRGGAVRQVNPAMFAAAPRYHSGGMVGLKPDERPAILQTGEEVLSRSDPRNAANGGAARGDGQGQGYRIINVTDPRMVEGALQTSSGEKAILNVLGRNTGALRQLIGR